MATKHDTKGQRRLVITPEALGELFTGGVNIKSSLPDNARLVSHWQNDAGSHVFLFESDGWEPMQEAEIIPEERLMFNSLDE